MNLMTKELESKFEKYPLYSQDDKGGDAIVIAHYFNPTGVGDWFITEGSKLQNDDYEMFGYCHLGDDDNAEFGYVMLSELESIKLPMGMGIERDLYCKEDTIVNTLNAKGFEVPSFLESEIEKEENIEM